MNIILWILQIFLALHTAIGAVWKFSHPVQTIPSLSAIPSGVWMGMGIFELACAVCLVLPLFYRAWGILVPIAAACIGAEMLVFCGLHLNSGDMDKSPIFYWLVVAAICAFIVYGRLRMRKL